MSELDERGRNPQEDGETREPLLGRAPLLADADAPRRPTLPPALHMTLAWATVACLAAVVIASVVVASLAVPDEPSLDAERMASRELVYFGRIGMGLERVLPGTAWQLVDPIDELVRPERTDPDATLASPVDILRAAIVLHELGEIEQAQELLDLARERTDERRVAAREDATRVEAALAILGEPAPDGDLDAERAALEAELEDAEASVDHAEALQTDLDLVERVLAAGSAADLEAAEQERLRTRHRFFGEIVLAQGVDAADEPRASLVNRATLTAGFAIAFVLVAIVSVIAGLALAVIGLVLLVQGSLRPRFQRAYRLPLRERALLVESMAIFLAGFIVVQLLVLALDTALGLDTGPVLVWALLLAAFWPLARGMSWSALRGALGWHVGGRGIAGLPAEVGCGIAGYLAGLPLLVLGVLVALLIITLTGAEPSHPALEEATETTVVTALQLYLLACVWAPLVEETIFRGSLYASLRPTWHPILAGLLVAFVFAAIHPQGLAFVPALMPLAITFALLREWRGSLVAPIVAHAIHNFAITTLALVIFA